MLLFDSTDEWWWCLFESGTSWGRTQFESNDWIETCLGRLSQEILFRPVMNLDSSWTEFDWCCSLRSHLGAIGEDEFNISNSSHCSFSILTSYTQVRVGVRFCEKYRCCNLNPWKFKQFDSLYPISNWGYNYVKSEDFSDSFPTVDATWHFMPNFVFGIKFHIWSWFIAKSPYIICENDSLYSVFEFLASLS